MKGKKLGKAEHKAGKKKENDKTANPQKSISFRIDDKVIAIERPESLENPEQNEKEVSEHKKRDAKKKEDKDKSIDNVVRKESEKDKNRRTRKFLDKEFENMAYMASQKQIDYENIFSYLRNNVKQSITSTGFYDYGKVSSTLNQEEDILNPTFGYEDVLEIIRAAKIKNTLGVEVYINPMKKEIFDAWKLGNNAENKFLYDSINI